MNRTIRIGASGVLVAAFAGLVVLAILEPVALLRGWLAAFVWVTMIPIGALTLLLVSRLTGGGWSVILGPVLESAARAVAGAALIGVPVLIFSAALYQWQASPLTPKSLTPAYMTAPLFALRSVIAFCIWTLLAWMPGLRVTSLGAGIGLFVLAVLTNIIPVDWIISAEPGFYSSDFGFGFGVEQVLTALALCAVTGVTRNNERRCRDLAGMTIAAILGTVYMYYMEFAVIWYGNLPGKVDWFNHRGDAPWAEIGGVAFAIGALIPFIFLLNDRVRGSAGWLQAIGAVILFGELLHVIFLVVPSFGLAALLPACLAILAFAIAGTLWLDRTIDRWGPETTGFVRVVQHDG
jgi:hypothetical protein